VLRPLDGLLLLGRGEAELDGERERDRELYLLRGERLLMPPRLPYPLLGGLRRRTNGLGDVLLRSLNTNLHWIVLPSI